MKKLLTIALIFLFTGWLSHCMFSDFEYHPEWYTAFRNLLIAVLVLAFIYSSYLLFKEWKVGEKLTFQIFLIFLHVFSPPVVVFTVYILIHFPIVTLHNFGVIPCQKIIYEANLIDKECSSTGGKVQCFAVVEGMKPQKINKIPVSFSQAKNLKKGAVTVYTLESGIGKYNIGVMQNNKPIN